MANPNLVNLTIGILFYLFQLWNLSGAELPPKILGIIKEKSSQKIPLFFKELKPQEPGVILKILYQSEPIFEFNVGVENLKTKSPLTEKSLFRLGSLSKSFTALAYLQLIDGKTFPLKSPISEYFPQEIFIDITPYHLLSHTSGLPDYEDLLEDSGLPLDKMTNSQVFTILASHSLGLVYDPGAEYRYCNTGFLVLSSLVEKLSGSPFSSYLEKNIFDPAQMKDSFVLVINNRKRSNPLVIGYSREENGFFEEEAEPVSDISGDGNVVSSLKDLIQLDRALRNFKIISPQNFELIKTPAQLKNKTPLEYSLGFEMKFPMEKKWVGHSGSWMGFSIFFYQQTQYPLTLILLSNNGDLDGDLPIMVEDILTALVQWE